jgi:uncharacterized protein YoxC
MVEYTCEKCQKIFDHKANYTTHINRKNPCDGAHKKCEYCEKSFTRKSSLDRHYNTCKIKNTINNNQIHNNNCTNPISVTGNNNGTINNINIIINPFGCDDMSKLTDKQKLSVLKKCYMSIPELIKMVNLNPDLPENHNVYISNMKSDFGHINNGTKWILTKVDELIDDVISKKKDDIEELLEAFEEALPEKVIDRIRDVIATLDYNPMSDDIKDKEKLKFKKKIKDEVKLLLYNNKEIPQATREKQKATEKCKK